MGLKAASLGGRKRSGKYATTVSAQRNISPERLPSPTITVPLLNVDSDNSQVSILLDGVEGMCSASPTCLCYVHPFQVQGFEYGTPAQHAGWGLEYMILHYI